MQPPDQPAPGEPTPVPPQVPPAGSTPPPAGEPPPMPDASSSSASTPKYNFGTVPAPALATPATADEKLWGLFMHLGGALGSFTNYVGIPGGNLLVPLTLWLIKKDESYFLNDQGKEVLNFQLCIFIVSLLCTLTCILIPVAYVLGVVALILGIVGGVKANEGVAYRYPFNFRLIK